jgi:hypothetical protein
MSVKRTKPAAPQETTPTPAPDAPQEEQEIFINTLADFFRWLMDAAEDLERGNSKLPVLSYDDRMGIIIIYNIFIDHSEIDRSDIDVVEKIPSDLLYYPDMKEKEDYRQTDTQEKDLVDLLCLGDAAELVTKSNRDFGFEQPFLLFGFSWDSLGRNSHLDHYGIKTHRACKVLLP